MNRRSSSNAFTLIEVILALGIFAVVLVAINTAFFAALRLRQRTSETLDQALPLDRALAVLRRDLQNAVPPGGTLSGNFRSDGPAGTTGTKAAGASSGGATASGGNKTLGATLGTSGQNGGLDFFTTTGTLSDDTPWGEVQEVNYQLMESTNRASTYGKDLVRSVTRNLLATSTPMPQLQRLASDVQSLDLLYYDGTQWRNTWDTTAGDTSLPSAVRVRIQLAPPGDAAARSLPPLEMVVLLNSQSVTNQ